jgi:glucose/arabinose dehydrogenase
MSRSLPAIKFKWILLVFAIILIIAFISANYFGVRPSVSSGIDNITLPDGFVIDVYADDLGSSLLSYPGASPGPRMLMEKDGLLFVSIPNKGMVVTLLDTDTDKKADDVNIFISGLDSPHGLDYYDGWFYIAEEGRLIRVRDDDGDLLADKGSIQVLISDLPKGGHYTRTVKVHDEYLYLSMGSSCNVCDEEDERRAAIIRTELDGSNWTVFASGLRNSVGLAFHPETGELYGTENGRDWLGDDLPPDEVNHIVGGGNYGWPICYGDNIHDTDFDKKEYIRNPCQEPDALPALVNLQAHSAPLGLTFYDGSSFPDEYSGDMFVCFHGSWNRQKPTGYKIVSIDMETLEVRDFATGWLQDNNVLGRPVDVMVAEDGSLFVSDDNAGNIYRIYYAG